MSETARLTRRRSRRKTSSVTPRRSARCSDFCDRRGAELGGAAKGSEIVVAYHSACSLQHGQKITTLPKELLFKSGFVVKDIPESHLCCGSAGTYNILQPQLAGKLRDRKISTIEAVQPDVIAAGNIGCLVQIEQGLRERGGAVPVLHTIELVDWATGGPRPEAMKQ